MERIAISERPGWREKATEFGFRFHTMHGEPTGVKMLIISSRWRKSSIWKR